VEKERFKRACCLEYENELMDFQLRTEMQRYRKIMARLYIGNLPHSTVEHELQAWIETHGFKVETVQVIRDLDTGASRGFAFVELPEVLHADEAVQALNGQKMEGHDLRVSEARPLPIKGETRHTTGTRSPRKKAS
jgi:RNA recognition motif-containing protein